MFLKKKSLKEVPLQPVGTPLPSRYFHNNILYETFASDHSILVLFIDIFISTVNDIFFVILHIFFSLVSSQGRLVCILCKVTLVRLSCFYSFEGK